MPAPTHTNASHELAVLLRSRIPLIVIETQEEARALALLSALSVSVARNAHLPMTCRLKPCVHRSWRSTRAAAA